MTTKPSSPRKPVAAPAEAAAAPFLDLWGDLPRQQLAVCTESLCAVLQGFENIRRVQAQAAHRALQRHESASTRLSTGCDAHQLASLQVDLVQHDLQEMGRYWQELGHAAMEMNQRLFMSLFQWGGPVAVEGVRQATDAASILSGFGEPFSWHPPRTAMRH
ncbi:phasin family protein [Ramlibacter sp. MAHUQ-53]|uniref:phasin family protein n=1 Tax=unclassified Ramlibacter TaxID=2617605 RepID=UPI003627E976